MSSLHRNQGLTGIGARVNSPRDVYKSQHGNYVLGCILMAISLLTLSSQFTRSPWKTTSSIVSMR